MTTPLKVVQPDPAPLPVTYTLDQVAAIFQVTRRSVERWAAAGKLKVFRLGGVVRVRKQELDAFGRENEE